MFAACNAELASNKIADVEREGKLTFQTFYQSFFDALKIKLFRFEVWTNRYTAAIFLATKIIQVCHLALFTTPGDR